MVVAAKHLQETADRQLECLIEIKTILEDRGR
jgi:hypothetical protein